MTAYRMVATAAGGPEVLTREDFTPADAGKGEIRIRQTAISLNYLDTYFRSGLYPWPEGADHVPGADASGVVEAVGEDADFAEGDRVCYTLPVGAYASHRVIPAARAVRIPDGVSDDVAACSMVKGMTAFYLLHRTFKVGPEHSVLFHAAAGGVGSIAGQWLREIGCTSIGTAGGSEKCAQAKALGFTHVIDYKAEDFVARVREITGGAGVHVVYDGIGKDTYPKSLDCLRRLGMFVTFGNASGAIENFSLKDIASRGGLFVTRPSLFNYIATREELDEAANALFARLSDGTIKIDINQEYALTDAAEAHRALEARETTGSTVLIP